MKKAHELPQAVNNLRAIWDKKKVEMKFTQVEAAAELGWSQGAISHYLNNITVLGPAAVIKFANFLGVDPLDIDPDVVAHLPNIQSIRISRHSGNISKTVDETFYHKNIDSAFNVLVDIDALVFEPTSTKGATFCREGEQVVAQVCDTSQAPNVSYFMVQLKGNKRCDFYHHTVVPNKNKIQRIYAVLNLMFSTENRAVAAK